MVQVGGKTKNAHKAAQPQFVVESGFGSNEYMKIVNQMITWVGDPMVAHKFSSKFAAKAFVRGLEGISAGRIIKELM